jgi:membrane protease YdiL (CAAX protease family)
MPSGPKHTPPPPPSPLGRGPTGLSGVVTLVLGLALLGLLFAASLAMPVVSQAVGFERAPETVARVYERRLELAAALEKLEPWERSALEPFLPVGNHVVEEALQAFENVIQQGGFASDGAKRDEAALDGLRARRAVLLADLGRLEEAQGDLDALAARGHAEFLDAVRSLAGGRANAEALALAGDGWIGRVARSRATRASEPVPASAATRTLQLARVRLGVIAIGAAILLAWLARNRPESPTASIAIPPAWTPQIGFGVLVRAGFAAFAIFLALELVGISLDTTLPLSIGALLASVPLFWLVRKHVVRPNGLSFGHVLGLRLQGPLVSWILTCLALFALDQIGSNALSTAARATGAVEPWVVSVDSLVLWGSGLVLAVSIADSLLFGVVAQELAFRGVLFPSLRGVHGPFHAALLSGLLFAAVQFVALPAMLALGWSGLVYALSVERTRSLVPALVVNVLGSSFAIAHDVALYR